MKRFFNLMPRLKLAETVALILLISGSFWAKLSTAVNVCRIINFSKTRLNYISIEFSL